MTNENRKIIKYFPPPPIIGTFYKYPNINKDKKLQKLVTDKFLKKLLKWLKSDNQYSHLKSKFNLFKTKKGFNVLHKFLKKLVKNADIKWYDLEDKTQLVKDYLIYKLGKI